MELVIKAVRLNTLAKLTNADTQRFEALIKDIFPGTEVKDALYKDLEDAIAASLKELKLDPLPSQIKKVVQLNENLNQRMGCVIVGPSGCGKSTLLRILRAAQAKMKQQIVVHTMNPKAMPRQQVRSLSFLSFLFVPVWRTHSHTRARRLKRARAHTYMLSLPPSLHPLLCLSLSHTQTLTMKAKRSRECLRMEDSG